MRMIVFSTRRMMAIAGGAAMALSILVLGADPDCARAAPPQAMAERLTPPKTVDLAPLASSQRQSVAPLRGAESPPRHMWSLPSGPISGKPLILSRETEVRRVQIPTLDVPPLAHESTPALPSVVKLLEAPGGRVFGPDSAAPLPLVRFAREKEAALRPVDDATADANLQLLVRPAPVAAALPAPPIAVGIPDPDAALRAVRYDGPALEPEPPNVSRELPPRPKLGDK